LTTLKVKALHAQQGSLGVNMSHEALRTFCQQFILDSRDAVLEKWDRIIRQNAKAPRSIELGDELKSLGVPREILEKIIYRVVDSCLFSFLNFIEQNEIDIIWDAENIRELSDGLAGELYSTQGWINRFSKFPSDEG